MHATKHTPSARIPNFRVPLAVVTLALVVLTVIGIQSLADRVSAPHPQALAGPTQAATTADQPGIPVGFAIVLLVLVGVVKLVSRARSFGARALPRGMYWDEW
jgi:hypothetical protein